MAPIPPSFDLPDGVATAPVYARDCQQAFELCRKLHPGCRIEAVEREDKTAEL